MRCSYCGAKIKRRNKSGNRDAVQQCPKAADYGRPPGALCEVRREVAPGPLTPPTRAERRSRK